MQVETALFFESIEQVYSRIFRLFKPRREVPQITVRFRKYANANSRISLSESRLTVHISDLLEGAPAPIHEALAHILLSKLFRETTASKALAQYRRYLNRPEMRRTLHLLKQARGRKVFRPPNGETHDLVEIFEELNLAYFHGLMARPELGWSQKASRITLGHYDPSHNTIVLTRLLDSEDVPQLLVKFVMFHEMLHLRYPAVHRGVRRCVHTDEFKQAEKNFDGYAEAKTALKKFVESAD